MEGFSRKQRIATCADDAYAWHTRPGAFRRLTPPWQQMELLESRGSFEERRLLLAMRIGPFRRSWVARHQNVRAGRSFGDIQERGPFSHWSHEHRFEPEGSHSSWLVDHVRYALPGGALGKILGSTRVHSTLETLFEYRHRVTADDLAAFAEARHHARPGRVLITGASGLIGANLCAFLEAGGHTVHCLSRKHPGSSKRTWNPEAGQLDARALEGIDAVVHLAGASVGRRWSSSAMRRIRNSRVRSARLLCESIARLPNPPQTLVIDDAIGIVHRALYDATLQGPVNAVAPHPVRNSEFTAMLARVLRRPAVISIPAPVIRALLGRMGEDLLLSSQRVQPQKLLETGYGFRFPELEGALRHVLGKPMNH